MLYIRFNLSSSMAVISTLAPWVSIELDFDIDYGIDFVLGYGIDVTLGDIFDFILQV